MPRDRNNSPNDPLGENLILKGSRDDVRTKIDKDWEKKSRDDVPPSNRPPPKNPLLNLTPHTPDEEQQGADNTSGKPDSKPAEDA